MFPWQRYDGDYTSAWTDHKKKPAKKAAAKKEAAKTKTPKKSRKAKTR